MTIKLKPDNGLALNQNIVLEQTYKSKIEWEMRINWCLQHNRPIYIYETLRYRTHYGEEPPYQGLTAKQVTKASARLKSRGYFDAVTGEITKKGIKAVENNDYIRSGPMGPHTGVRKPPKGTLSSYVWAALRAKNSATIEELLSLVPLDDTDYDKTVSSTRRLLFWLCKAMIVRRLPRKKEGYHYNSRGHIRYQLMIDLGPKHPIIRQRKHQVYDPNTHINVQFKDVLKAFKR